MISEELKEKETVNKNETVVNIENLNFWYGETQILKNISFQIYKNKITSIMGPSGCGKTTLLRCINRMSELNPDSKVSGKIFLYDKNIYDIDPIELRRHIGMVFQKPNPFPTMTIYENVLAGYILNGIKLKKSEKDRIVEEALYNVGLFEEVKNKLYQKGTNLSGGQQQRLCIARAIAMKPYIILFDEPTSALDPVSSKKIEELIENLKKDLTIIIVTHNIAQAARISDYTAFLYLGELIEYDRTEIMMSIPKDKRTEQYLTGKFG